VTSFARFYFLSLPLVVLAAWGSVCHAKSFYVSPEGNDSGPGTADRPFQTIVRARDAVRATLATQDEDIIVYLKGGTYVLTNPIEFTTADSGRNGHAVIYQNSPGEKPVICGGKSITGWTLHDAGRNIWKARVGPGDDFRQIYVNGIKGIRARSDGPAGLQPTATGFTTKETWLKECRNASNMEIVVSPHEWQQERLPIASVNGGDVTIQEPCWSIVKQGEYPGYSNPQWVENAYELLTKPGYWYLDRQSNTLYYMPRPGENMSNAVVEVPVAEQMFRLSGSVEAPVVNLKFIGLSFRLSNWVLPNTSLGLPSTQANQPEPETNDWAVKAAIDCSGAHEVVIKKCNFTQLGGNGINLLTASKNVIIDSCYFSNLSASAIQIGRGSKSDMGLKNGDPNIVSEITVSNCIIHDVATDYQAGCGIFAGLVQDCTLTHNELFNLPYGGISLGWGWGKKVTFTTGNKILYNKIHDYLQVLADSGGIYCNGEQENGLIEGNYLYNQGNRFAHIYLDDGSTHWSVRRNVCKRGKEEEWYLFKGHDNHAEENYTDSYFVRDMNDGSEPCSVKDTTWISLGAAWVVSSKTWPKSALDIMNAAGPVSDQSTPPNE